MKRFSNGVMWGALLFFALGYFLVLVGKSQPRQPVHMRPAPKGWHMMVQDPASKVVLFQVWFDDFTIDHKTIDESMECFRSGQRVLRIEHVSKFYYQIDSEALPGYTVEGRPK